MHITYSLFLFISASGVLDSSVQLRYSTLCFFELFLHLFFTFQLLFQRVHLVLKASRFRLLFRQKAQHSCQFFIWQAIVWLGNATLGTVVRDYTRFTERRFLAKYVSLRLSGNSSFSSACKQVTNVHTHTRKISS